MSVTIDKQGSHSFGMFDNNPYVDTYNAMMAFTVLQTYWGYATQSLSIPWGAMPGAKLVNPLEVLYPCGGDRSEFIPGPTDPEILLSQTEFALDAKAVGAGFGEYLAFEAGCAQAQCVRGPQFPGKRPAPHQRKHHAKLDARRPGPGLWAGFRRLVRGQRGGEQQRCVRAARCPVSGPDRRIRSTASRWTRPAAAARTRSCR